MLTGKHKDNIDSDKIINKQKEAKSFSLFSGTNFSQTSSQRQFVRNFTPSPQLHEGTRFR